jgi:membrane fusion protein (multidrug efflux system)
MSTTTSDIAPAALAVPPSTAPTAKPAKRVALFIVLPLALIALGIFGWNKVRYNLAHEETDNAQVEAHISPLLPRVSGYVARVLVDDNQRVTAGQPLVEIDPAELDLRITTANAARQNAEAALKTAEASLANAKAAQAVAQANIQTSQVAQAKAASDLARDVPLAKSGAITDRQLTDSKAAADTANAQLEALRRQADAAAAQVDLAETQIATARTQIEQRIAEVDFAKLQRSYSTLVAPIAGVISRKNVEPGQYVQAGQTLLSIASEDALWIVANFKETQLADMHVGQKVEIIADTFPDHVFMGEVTSLSGATGARFALLPPDNATGNFVKVTQRVPVKIALTQPADPAHPLRAGLSVQVAVRTRE